MKFRGTHILSADQFSRDDLKHIFHIADQIAPYAQRKKITTVLHGAILSNMFYEPSTRTRISFGCAFNLLGGYVRETATPEQSSVAKGESLYDTARVLSGYSDIIVLRHPEAGSAETFSAASRVPVINGGDGDNEHPSQALLDLYTIYKEFHKKEKNGAASIDGLRIALVGDLKYGRAVHSLCRLLALGRNIKVNLISPHHLALPQKIEDILTAAGHEVNRNHNMVSGITHVDIIYASRIQSERMLPSEANQFNTDMTDDLYRKTYHLNKAIYTQHCEPNTVIMHPLPRDSRSGLDVLDDDLNEHPNLAIFRQTDNGTIIRMCLFALIFNVVDQIDTYTYLPAWKNLRKSNV